LVVVTSVQVHSKLNNNGVLVGVGRGFGRG
jgi:hypothetical protein